MAKGQMTDRYGGHPLLRALRHEPWSAAGLAEMLGQAHFMYRCLLDLEARYRSVWQEDLPVSRLVAPLRPDTLPSLEACLYALGSRGTLVADTATRQLCETWTALDQGDPLLAFATVAIGAYWPEPAWRQALREALWHQPRLLNGEACFFWRPGGPEGESRRRVWHEVMALGVVPGRVARLARVARIHWYDRFIPEAAPVAHGTEVGPRALIARV